MALTIKTFSDLLKIIETHPEWRRKLVKALFPEIDLPRAFQRLAEAQERMDAAIERLIATQERMGIDVGELKTDVGELKTDVGELKTDVRELKTDVAELKTDVRELKTDVAELKTDVRELKTDVRELKTDVAELKTDNVEIKTDIADLKTDMGEVKHTVGVLKGKSHERDYRDKAASIFGRYIRRGRDMTNEIADQLQKAEETDQISGQEFNQVLAADLLWGGQLRQAKDEIVLVVEASWLAEMTDVERVSTRANILRKIRLNALPVVAGHEWTKEAAEAAQEQKVVMTTNGLVDNASWQNALSE